MDANQAICNLEKKRYKTKDTYTLKEVCDIAGITAEDLANAPTPEVVGVELQTDGK